MEIRVLKTIPGYTENQYLNAGDTATVSDGLAVSLINDGYVEPVTREAPAATRETAVANNQAPKPRGRKAAS